MKVKLGITTAIAAMCILCGIGATVFSGNNLVQKSENDEKCAWFKDARFGMFIHWGIYAIPGKGEWSYAVDKYAPGEYEANAKIFNPVKKCHAL